MLVPRRIGLVVPSSNTTMETEIPALLRAWEAQGGPGRFTFHGARMRMKKVTPEELLAMDAQAAGCAGHLADAQCDALAYACLVAVMVQGPGAHAAVGERLRAATREAGCEAPVVTSAGAIVEEVKAAGYRRVSLIAPYVPELTRVVRAYIEGAGVEVVDAISLSVSDNCAVGRLSPMDLVGLARDRLQVKGADAVVLSSCVQMPSLEALAPAEQATGLPCLSAAAATTRSLLRALKLPLRLSGYGSFLDRPEEG